MNYPSLQPWLDLKPEPMDDSPTPAQALIRAGSQLGSALIARKQGQEAPPPNIHEEGHSEFLPRPRRPPFPLVSLAPYTE